MATDSAFHPPTFPPREDHRGLAGAVIALALLLVLASWSFALGDGYADYLLMIVSFFFLLLLALAGALWRMGKKYRRVDADNSAPTPLGATAKIEILTPLAAVALGMAAFGLLFRIVGG